MNYIKEIQGLRAVAALLVAVYHIWFNRVSGGVDAFFVIAAFFLLSTFSRIENVTIGDLTKYYASTLRRVMPIAAVVIAVTIVGTLIFIPRIHWREFAFHSFASALFVENWWLAWTGTDYLRRGLAASPFQQMWALSLQMQYYLILPLILWGLSSVGRVLGFGVIKVWTSALMAGMAASFLYSIYITNTNQPWAYFDSFARCWEYMLGGLLALHMNKLPALPYWASRLLGYVSLLSLISFAAFVPVANMFPGYAALIPVVSTLGLIVAARAGGEIKPLTSSFILALGNISFSFYLWHWPLLVFWRQWSNDATVGFVPGLAIILCAGALAWITLTIIETPFRRWSVLASRPVVSILASSLLMAPIFAGTYAWAATNRSAMHDAQLALAAFAKSPRNWVSNGSIVPDPLVAKEDLPTAYAQGCQQDIHESDLIECVYGKKDGTRTLVLVGGSHSTQWLPALEDLATGLDLKIVTMLKSSCTFFDPTSDVKVMAVVGNSDDLDIETCRVWNAASRDRIISLAPDLVLTIGTRGRGPEEQIPEAFLDMWAVMTARNIPVLALRDNPWFDEDIVDCVSEFIQQPTACDKPRAIYLSHKNPGRDLVMAGVTFVDLADLYCDISKCWAVSENLLLYRDRHHLTESFVRAHSDRLGRDIEQILGRP